MAINNTHHENNLRGYTIQNGVVNSSFELNSKQKKTLLALGEMILGIREEELGEEFITEANLFIDNLEEFLISDLSRLLDLFNSRITSLFLSLSIKPFTKMEPTKKVKFYNKWVKSRISLLRTGASTLRALCGWSYYSLDKSWNELKYPGIPLNRENETPTLLEGKEPWSEGMEVK